MHHLRKSIISIIVLSSCILFKFAKAESSNFQIKGSARARVEVRNNSDFNKNVSDYTDFTGSRFRLDMSFKQSEKTIVFFQPQFTKIWGQTEFVPNGTSSSTEKETSGVLNDTSLDVHQAYLKYNFNDNFAFTAGRKELNYGDQLLLGGVGWSNQGRSFDLIQFHQKWEHVLHQVFWVRF